MDKQPFSSRKILDHDSRMGFDRQKGVKELLPIIVSRGLRMGVLLRHNPFISHRSNYDLFLVDNATGIRV